MEDRILDYAPEEMKGMLASVYAYNSYFASKKQEKLFDRILFAISVVDRKFFVEENCYIDNALPIGEGQTISQPSTVARMLLSSDLKPGDDVLEVGAGSGWNACLIALLVYPGSVTSVDRIESLVKKAEKNISKLRNHLKQVSPQNVEKISKINFIVEDALSGKKSWKRKYDKIIITAGISDKETEMKIEKMAEGLLRKNGILICPYVSGPLLMYQKKEKLKRQETKEHYVFVPLVKGEK